MTDKKPKHPDPRDRDKPSRFPEVFPHLEAEEWAAIYLHHSAEDELLLCERTEITDVSQTLYDGVRSWEIRYLDILDAQRDKTPYNEWLLESREEPYWRVVFRTNIKNDWPPTQIVSIVAPEHAKEFLLIDVEAFRG